MKKGSQKRQITTGILEEGGNNTYINVSTEGFDIGLHNKGTNSLILGGSHLTSSVSGALTTFATLQTKLEPLFTAQSALSSSISALDFGLSASTKASISSINTSLSPVLESVRSLSDTLANVSKLTIDARLLFTKPSYDFLNNPYGATLSTAMDTIKIGQDRLSTSLLSIGKPLSSSFLIAPNQVTNIGILGNMSLGALQSPIVVSPITTDRQKIEKLDDKYNSLEAKINKISSERDALSLTDITKQVAQELEKVDPELAKCFKGAMTTLIVNQSEDLVGQVAESLTRVVENLPFRLASQSITFSAKKSPILIANALGDYLGLTEEQERKSHPLISQQQNFYITLSDIRHRNGKAYAMYGNDRRIFRALIISVEAYIYLLLTFRNEK